MSAGGVVGAGLRLWRENWFRWGVVALAFSGVTTILIAAVDPWTATFGALYSIGPERFSLPDPNPLAVLLSLVSGLFLGPWEAVILSRAALHATVTEPLRGSALLGRTIRGVHSMLWIFVLLVLLAFLVTVPVAAMLAGSATSTSRNALGGLFALILFGVLLWAVPRLATVSYVFVGEDQRGTRALRGTWRLSRGAWPLSAGTLLLTLLIAVAIAVIPSLIASEMFPYALTEDAVPRAIVQSLVTALVAPLGTAILAGLYLELRARKGLNDQTALRAKLARFDGS
jgi:hypothetical protein